MKEISYKMALYLAHNGINIYMLYDRGFCIKVKDIQQMVAHHKNKGIFGRK